MAEKTKCETCANLEEDDDDFDYCPYWISCRNGKMYIPKENDNG